jgi:tetratricopeptide (TPR) repeat protein
MMTDAKDSAVLLQETVSDARARAPSDAAASDVAIGGIRGLLRRFWYVPVLIAYAVMVAYTAMHHEPWIDEAQAWLIARDCDLGTLFSEVLRYEGHPALWYLIVKAAIFCGLPYEGFCLFSGAIATMGVWLLLAKSPFPKWAAACLPFTFFLGYQYAVVARSYVLLPLLLFAVAALRRDRWEKPIRWIVVLLLVANVSSHSFLIACGIMFVHVVELFFRRSHLDAKARNRQLAAVALYTVGALGVVVTLWPARDCATATGVNGQIVFAQLWDKTLSAVDSAFFGCPSVTIGLLLVSCYWFWKTGVLPLFLASCLPVLGVFAFLRVSYHHHGILFIAWLFVLWCSVDAFLELRRRGEVDRRLRETSYVMVVLVAGLILRQCLWTFDSVRLDAANPYCGAAALAKEIKDRGLTKYRLAMQREWAVAVQPYFSKNIFVNFPNPRGLAFVDWHVSSYPEMSGCTAGECLTEPCDILIWAEKGRRIPTLWTVPGLAAQLPPNWRYVGYFRGQTIYKDRLGYSTGFGMFAVRRVADELGLPTVEYDAAVPKIQRAGVIMMPHEFAMCSAQFHLEFGNLLRKIEPASAIRQYEFAIAASSDVDSRCFVPAILGRLQYLTASAHCGLAVSLVLSDPELAMEHLQAALKLVPNDSDTRVGKAAALAQRGKLPEATDELRQALWIARARLIEDLCQGATEQKRPGNGMKTGDLNFD